MTLSHNATPLRFDTAPCCDGPVYIRQLMALDYIKIRQFSLSTGEDEENPYVMLFMACAYIGNENNKRLFDYDNLDEVGELPVELVSWACEKGNEYNSAMQPGAVEEAEKN